MKMLIQTLQYFQVVNCIHRFKSRASQLSRRMSSRRPHSKKGEKFRPSLEHDSLKEKRLIDFFKAFLNTKATLKWTLTIWDLKADPMYELHFSH